MRKWFRTLCGWCISVIFVVKDRFDSTRLHSRPWVYTEVETEAEGLWNGRNRLVSTMSPNNSEANSMVARQHWPNKDRCWNGQRDHQDWPRRKFSSLSPVLATLPSLLLSSRWRGSLCHYGSLSLASLSTKRTSVLRNYVPVPREPVDKWMRRNRGWIKEWTMLEWTVARPRVGMVREGRCERRDRGKCFEGRKWCSMFSLFMDNLILDVSLVN